MVSQERLKELFTYNPDTGLLFRLSNSKNVETISKTGYSRTHVDGKQYRTHRVIWMLVHGVEPEEIDHINGARADNRLCNLRNVTKHENTKNHKLRPDNVSGCSGVNFHRASGKWIAQIRDHGKYIYLGTFSELEIAVSARKAAEEKYGYHKNHGQVRKRYERD